MPKTPQLDEIMQQLDVLSLVDLLKVRAIVDVLIEVKSSSLFETETIGSYHHVTSGSTQAADVDVSDTLHHIAGLSIKGFIKSVTDN